MFEELFIYPKVLARHQHGPEASKRARYLKHLADQGAARETLLRLAREMLIITERLDLSTDRLIEREEIKAAAQSWAEYQHTRSRAAGEEWSRRLFQDIAAAWLRFLGQLQEPSVGETKIHSDKIDDFIAYQQDERGLSASTLAAQRWQVENFLGHLGTGKSSIAAITVVDVDAFLDLKGRGGWSRASVATCAHALRAFFRHAQRRQWCSQGLASAIDAPRLFRQEALPRGPAWTDVQRLLESSTDGPASRYLRDHAILKLLAIYGLRSGEVRQLRLEDSDEDIEARCRNGPAAKAIGGVVAVPQSDGVLNGVRMGRPQASSRNSHGVLCWN